MESKTWFIDITNKSRKTMKELYQYWVSAPRVQEFEFAVIPITDRNKLRKLLFGSYEGLPFSHRTSRTSHGNPIPSLRKSYFDFPQQEKK